MYGYIIGIMQQGALLNPSEPTEPVNALKDSETGTLFRDSATGKVLTDSGKED